MKYSIGNTVRFRLQKFTDDSGFVDVLLTPDMFDADGTMNREIVAEVAARIGRDPSIKWSREEQFIQVHPIQTPSREPR